MKSLMKLLTQKINLRLLTDSLGRPLATVLYRVSKENSKNFVLISAEGEIINETKYKTFLKILNDLSENRIERSIAKQHSLEEERAHEAEEERKNFPGRLKLEAMMEQRFREHEKENELNDRTFAEKRWQRRTAIPPVKNRDISSERARWALAEGQDEIQDKVIVDFLTERPKSFGESQSKGQRAEEQAKAEAEAEAKFKTLQEPYAVGTVISIPDLGTYTTYLENPQWGDHLRLVQFTHSPGDPAAVGNYALVPKNSGLKYTAIFTSWYELLEVIREARMLIGEVGGSFPSHIGAGLRNLNIDEAVVAEVVESLEASDYKSDTPGLLSDPANGMHWFHLANELMYAAQNLYMDLNILSMDGEPLSPMDIRALVRGLDEDF